MRGLTNGTGGVGDSSLADKKMLILKPTAATSQQKLASDLRELCEKIRKRASLTPPSIIDALCEDVPTRWICLKATYVEEVRELASMLNRGHLLRFIAEC